MSETRLERYLLNHRGRVHTNKGAGRKEKQCACWQNMPDDDPSGHISLKLYRYVTLRGQETWLCKKCLISVANIDAMTHTVENWSDPKTAANWFRMRQMVDPYCDRNDKFKACRYVIPDVQIMELPDTKDLALSYSTIDFLTGKKVVNVLQCEAWPKA